MISYKQSGCTVGKIDSTTLITRPSRIGVHYHFICSFEFFLACVSYVLPGKIFLYHSVLDVFLVIYMSVDNYKRCQKISKPIDREFKLKLAHCLVLKQKDFCNAWLYVLPNTYLHGLQMILNAVVKMILNIPRCSTDWTTLKAIELHFLPVKSRVEFKACLLAQ